MARYCSVAICIRLTFFQLSSGLNAVVLRRDLRRLRPEILLVHDAVVVDHEGRDAGIAVFGRPGDQRETADHLALHDVVVRAAGRIAALAGEELVVVAAGTGAPLPTR